MVEHPLKPYEGIDAKLMQLVNSGRDLALGDDGALPKKYKFLIAMVLDASHGAADGVGRLAQQAMQNGATKQEVADALRIAEYICGVGCIYTATRGLKGAGII